MRTMEWTHVLHFIYIYRHGNGLIAIVDSFGLSLLPILFFYYLLLTLALLVRAWSLP